MSDGSDDYSQRGHDFAPLLVPNDRHLPSAVPRSLAPSPSSSLPNRPSFVFPASQIPKARLPISSNETSFGRLHDGFHSAPLAVNENEVRITPSASPSSQLADPRLSRNGPTSFPPSPSSSHEISIASSSSKIRAEQASPAFSLHITSRLPSTKKRKLDRGRVGSEDEEESENADASSSINGQDINSEPHDGIGGLVTRRGEDIAMLPAPLPSKRFKKNATARAVLIPVEQLPVYPLPPVPPINSPELVERVFTHCSLFEKARGVFEESEEAPHYEKLEHVGDSILGMLVTTWLHESKPGLPCGTATKLKAHLVSNATLSHISGMYNFPQRLTGNPRLLPVLRAQTDVRAAIVEAYIAALYFSYPIAERFTVALPAIDKWLRELLEPLYDFFYQYMKNEYAQHHAATGAGLDGIVITAPDQGELDKHDKDAEGMALLVEMYGTTKSREVSWEAERFETSVGVLWRMTCLVDGIEMGEATRAVKRRAKNVAAWEVAKKLGLTTGLTTI